MTYTPINIQLRQDQKWKLYHIYNFLPSTCVLIPLDLYTKGNKNSLNICDIKIVRIHYSVLRITIGPSYSFIFSLANALRNV